LFLNVPGVSTLGALAANHRGVLSQIKASGAIEVVILAMMAAAKDLKLQLEACSTLEIFSSWPSNKKAIASGGGITLIWQAMKVHSKKPALQQRACLALVALIRGNPANQHTVAESDATALLDAALVNCPDASEVSEVVSELRRVLSVPQLEEVTSENIQPVGLPDQAMLVVSDQMPQPVEISPTLEFETAAQILSEEPQQTSVVLAAPSTSVALPASAVPAAPAEQIRIERDQHAIDTAIIAEPLVKPEVPVEVPHDFSPASSAHQEDC
jgi:hypothetical protein